MSILQLDWPMANYASIGVQSISSSKCFFDGFVIDIRMKFNLKRIFW